MTRGHSTPPLRRVNGWMWSESPGARTSGTMTSAASSSGVLRSADWDPGGVATGGVVAEGELAILDRVGRRAGSRRWRNLGRQTHVAQDSLGDSRLLNQGDEAQASPTRRACQDVEPETAAHQVRPSPQRLGSLRWCAVQAWGRAFVVALRRWALEQAFDAAAHDLQHRRHIPITQRRARARSNPRPARGELPAYLHKPLDELVQLLKGNEDNH
jgi:hypothetical protein